ncbi:PKD domain-containing protein [Kitasatospora sp. NPDC056181]|uniref:PKD domain-containing protein n=1 Tax=Kitasatospora sp. NPDC056181 TaxID=3345737 RepID=UPI0035E2C17B
MRLRHAVGLSAAVVSAVVGLPLPAVAAESAAVLYVRASNGFCTDSGPGTEARPFCTIQAAADKVQPGQTVDVFQGDYLEDVVVRRSGEPGKPITFRGRGRLGRAALHSQPTIAGPSRLPVRISGRHDIVFSGFEVKGFELDNVSRVELSGNWIGKSDSETVRPGVSVTGPSERVTVERSVFHETTGGGVKLGAGVTGTRISGNDFATVFGAPAVSVTDAPGTLITSNTVHWQWSTAIAIDLVGVSDHATIANNVVARGTVQVSPASTAGTSLDYNNVLSASPGEFYPAYKWAGVSYMWAANLAAATGQGKHDDSAYVEFDDTYSPLSVPLVNPNQARPALIDSADPQAPGVPATDLLGHSAVDHPDVANTGPAGSFRDRGAYEVVGLDDVRLEARGTVYEPPTGPAPFTVELKATATNTWPTKLAYTFDFGDGTAPVTTADATVRHTYTTPAEYHPQVTVTDDRGGKVTDRLEWPVRVGEDKPLTASLTVAADSGRDPLAVTADVTATASSPWPIANLSYDFGDGTAQPVDSYGPARHVYARPGTYTVKGTVTDASGATVTSTGQVTVAYTPSGFTAIAPTRILDSREPGSRYPRLGPGETMDLYVRGRSTGATDIVPPGATAVVLNLTATGGTANSHLDVYPSQLARSATSNVNFGPGQDVANLVTVPIGPDGLVVVRNNAGYVHPVADVLGYFKGDSPDRFTSVAPARLLDTRSDDSALGQGATRRLKVAGAGGVPANATSVVLNVTATESTSTGFFTVYPAGTARPAAGSNLNTVPGRNIPNQVVVPLGADGSVELYNRAGRSHAVVDVFGYYSPDGKGLFTPVAPTRLLDSRDGSPFGPGSVRTVGGVPAGATAAAVNLTATETTVPTHLTAWASGGVRPGTSNLNATPGLDVPNHTTIPVDAQGRFDLANNAGTTHVVADLFGYYRNQ